jgi:LmbE family N-acetylglucosaminyl deacetylase
MKTIVGVFAHPDDEALGPSGTLAKLAKENNVYLICVTSGEASGKTHDEKKSIGETRRAELLASAEILGIKDVYFLGYEDGELNNNLYHRLANDIQAKLAELKPDTLLTFEWRGISGHIDHITVSLVTTYVFNKLTEIKEVMYYCLCSEESDMMKDYFIFFPPGYNKDEVHEVISVEEVWSTKVQAMRAHKSQMHDVDTALEHAATLPKEEYFLIKKR